MSINARSIAVGLGVGWAVAVLVTLTTMGNPVDAWCYYGFDSANPWNPDGCFLYSPPVALVMDAIRTVMPFDVFYTLLRSAEMFVLVVVAGPAIGLTLFIPAVAIELNAVNINLLIVGAVLIGFRHPWAWAFIILTKVTPGVGLLWFAVRKEWRHLAIALAATLGLAGLSVVVAPELWRQYIAGLGVTGDSSIFVIGWRLPLAALLVVWGARGNHRWALMVVVFLALPRWYYLSPVLLVGLFPLVRLARPIRLPVMPRLPHAARLGRPQPAAATSDGLTARAPSS